MGIKLSKHRDVFMKTERASDVSSSLFLAAAIRSDDVPGLEFHLNSRAQHRERKSC